MTLILLSAGLVLACTTHLLLDAYRSGCRRRAQLQGIELRADTSWRDEAAQALKATGGGSW